MVPSTTKTRTRVQAVEHLAQILSRSLIDDDGNNAVTRIFEDASNDEPAFRNEMAVRSQALRVGDISIRGETRVVGVDDFDGAAHGSASRCRTVSREVNRSAFDPV